jgi:DNA-binding response OmpR family regulator
MARKRAVSKASGNPLPSEDASADPASQELRCGRLCLITSARQIYRDGNPLFLTSKEYDLLSTFMRHSGEVLPRSFLIREVWDTDYLGDTRMLDVHIRWLRKKIEDDPSAPTYLRTVRNVGYRFEPPPSDT